MSAHIGPTTTGLREMGIEELIAKFHEASDELTRTVAAGSIEDVQAADAMVADMFTTLVNCTPKDRSEVVMLGTVLLENLTELDQSSKLGKCIREKIINLLSIEDQSFN